MRRLVALLAFVYILLLMAGPQCAFADDAVSAAGTPPSDEVQNVPGASAEHNKQGIAFFEKKDYGAALLEFNRAIAEDPQNINALINRGLAFAGRGEYDAAIENLYYALNLKEDNTVALKHLAAIYFLTHQYGKAVKTYDRIGTLNPLDYEIYTKQGIAFSALGAREAPIEDFTRTIYLTTKYLPAFVGRGISFTEQGKYKWAISDLDRAVSMSHDAPFVYLMRSEALAKASLFKNALADLNKACALGYDEVCAAIKQSKADIEAVTSTFVLQYAKKGADEELYNASRSKLEGFFNDKKLSGMDGYFRDDLKPVTD